MTPIRGLHHLSLSVTDLARSVDWYTRVLGFAVDSEVEREGFRRVRLGHPATALILTLTQHDGNGGERFDETRTGLDHLSFELPQVGDVAACKRWFEEQGVQHSEVKQQPGGVWTITLRDPDNVQLEVMAIERK